MYVYRVLDDNGNLGFSLTGGQYFPIFSDRRHVVIFRMEMF